MAFVYENVEREFADHLRSLDFKIDGDAIMDGQWHRVQVDGDVGKAKNGTYRGWNDPTGRPTGLYQNYKGGDGQQKWLAEGRRTNDPVDARIRAERREAMRERAQQQKVELEATHERQAQLASELLARMPAASDDHAYLVRKGVGADQLKVDKYGNLVMPLTDEHGKVWSVQRIKPDGEKTFMKDARTHGLFYQVGTDSADAPQILSEGYATAMSIHVATGLPVKVALNAGNLLAVAQALQASVPGRDTVLASDNDHIKEAKGKPNVGKAAAIDAGLQIGGFAMYPEFDAAESGSDWNDLHALRGIAAVREQFLDGLARAEAAVGVDRTYHQLGAERSTAPHILTVGYASGKALAEATDLPVKVVLDSAALLTVGQALAARDDGRSILIAGENDHALELNGKPNPGKAAALTAALEVQGYVCWPRFEKDDKGTSWSDLKAIHGLGSVAEQMGLALQDVRASVAGVPAAAAVQGHSPVTAPAQSSTTGSDLAIDRALEGESLVTRVERLETSMVSAMGRGDQLGEGDRKRIVDALEEVMNIKHSVAVGGSLASAFNAMPEQHHFAAMHAARTLASVDGPEGGTNPFTNPKLRDVYQSERAASAAPRSFAEQVATSRPEDVFLVARTAAERTVAANTYPALANAFALEAALSKFARSQFGEHAAETFMEAQRKGIAANLASGKQLPGVRIRVSQREGQTEHEH